MVTGERLFNGESVSDTLAAVLTKDPDWTKVPAKVQRLLKKCLQKDPKDRLRDIADAWELVEEATAQANLTHSVSLSTKRPPLWQALALLTILLAGGTLLWMRWWRPGIAQPQRAVPLLTSPGVKRHPSFSPEGDRIAFSWEGSNQDNPDIWVQQISGGPPFRLTEDPGNDYTPAWSPDGRWIAFLRVHGDTHELRLKPPLGGPERKLTDLRPRRELNRSRSISWSPDSSYIVVTDSEGEGKGDALYSVSLDSGEKRQLTHPDPLADINPSVSPDGQWLVFERMLAPGAQELQLLQLGASLNSTAEPRRLTQESFGGRDATWMPDSKEILFVAKGGLWKVSISEASTPSRLPFVGEDAVTPAISRAPAGRPSVLAYVRSYQDANIYRVDVPAPGVPAPAPPVAAISSTRTDWTPQYSPDGRRVAFASGRSGTFEIWLSDPDGSNAVQLTQMGASPGYPRWSPDGQWVVFHSNPNGRPDVILVSASGGKPRIVTSHLKGGGFPTFGRDESIYFTAAEYDLGIAKLSLSGGEITKVIGALSAAKVVSADGSYIYFVERFERPSTLWRVPTAGGEPVKMLDGILQTAFALVDKGIYFIDQPANASIALPNRSIGETRLQYLDLSTGKVTMVARNLGNIGPGLTVSQDGRTILFTRIDSPVDDLMLVENFR